MTMCDFFIILFSYNWIRHFFMNLEITSYIAPLPMSFRHIFRLLYGGSYGTTS